MQLVEQHIIGRKHKLYKEIDEVCFFGKNLYNRANYIVRQEFINTTKEKEAGTRTAANWIRYHELQKTLQKEVDYTKLPAKVSQQVLMNLDKSWKSFFTSIKDWKKNPSKYLGRPRLPRYKDKVNGRAVLTYTIQAISRKKLRTNIVLLSGTKISVPTKQKNICQARIVPKKGFYVIEIIYEKEVEKAKVNPDKIAGIDLGINNLAAVTSNLNIQPILVNGRPLKSMNQFYNKKRAELQSYVANKSSRKLERLTNKRNRKVNYYLHNASRWIVNYLVQNEIGTLVIGKNKLWKTEVNIGKRNNQSFVNIPHEKFVHMLTYKCELVGIKVMMTEESYTSKCSFIDKESLEHHEEYMGKRKHRGLFITKEKSQINADCNGSGNIIRKVIPNAFADGIEGVVVHPARFTPCKLAA